MNFIDFKSKFDSLLKSTSNKELKLALKRAGAKFKKEN